MVGELPIRKDLKPITEEGYSVNFYLRDSFGSVVGRARPLLRIHEGGSKRQQRI